MAHSVSVRWHCLQIIQPLAMIYYNVRKVLCSTRCLCSGFLPGIRNAIALPESIDYLGARDNAVSVVAKIFLHMKQQLDADTLKQVCIKC
jgi:hypothetical protein